MREQQRESRSNQSSVRDGANSPEDVENVAIVLRSNDPAATVIGIYANKASRPAAGALAIEAGATENARKDVLRSDSVRAELA